jgi:hypothetical protein
MTHKALKIELLKKVYELITSRNASTSQTERQLGADLENVRIGTIILSMINELKDK